MIPVFSREGTVADDTPSGHMEAVCKEALFCLLTNDVETHSIWHNCLRDETGEKVLKEGMPILLELYKKYDIKSTFYFTGYIAQKYPDVVLMVLPDGHEVGCHGLSHEVHHGFDVLSPQQQVAHLRRARAILEDITGRDVISFRAPALRVNRHTPGALIEAGFKIDSSIASQRFDMFMSFGGRNKLRWLGAPRLPYRTRRDDLSRAGEGPLVEVPISAFVYPYVGTTLRITPRLTRILRYLLHQESRLNRKPIVFDIHPNEFLEESEGKRTITRRARGFIGYVLQDLIRGKLKVKNLGHDAIPLYEQEIRFFKQHGYVFSTIQDYCKAQGFNL